MNTTLDILSYIRKFNLLKDWTDKQILVQLNKSIRENLLIYSLDENAKLSGVAFGELKIESRMFHCICMIGRGKLREYVKYFKSRFPSNFIITAYRKNGSRFVVYHF